MHRTKFNNTCVEISEKYLQNVAIPTKIILENKIIKGKLIFRFKNISKTSNLTHPDYKTILVRYYFVQVITIENK